MRKSRRALSIALSLIGASLVLLGATLLYARTEIFDADSFADDAERALADDRVEEALAQPIVDQIIDGGPSALINARPILESVVVAVIDSRPFRSLFRNAVREAHSLVFEGDPEAVILNLTDATVVVIEGLKSVNPQLASQIPEDLEAGLIELTDDDFALDTAGIAGDIAFLGIALLVLALLAFAAAVTIVADRRQAMVTVSVSLAVAAGVGLIALLVGRTLTLAQFDDPLIHDAVAATWDSFLGGLRNWMLGIGGLAIAASAGASAAGREVDTGAPLRRLGTAIATTPATPGRRLSRGIVLGALGLFLILRPDLALSVVAVIAGGYGVFVALTELLAILAPRPEDREAPLAERTRRWLARPRRIAVGAGAVVLIAAVVVVAVTSGGGDGEPGRPAGPPAACNGHPELCDKHLDQVAFPATHNSMSAAREPGWFTPNQRNGIGEQLDDGIRALLIDTHYGSSSPRDVVVTDLAKEDTTREEALESLGPVGVERAEALIGRLTFGDDSPRESSEPYLCHVLCELGATELGVALEEIREFLETHPDEFVIVFIEDVVSPEETAEAFEESGLLRFAYVHDRAEPFPRLGELIQDDERLLVLAENDAGEGSFPWYHEGFELFQETPYTFSSAKELARRTSCAPNRGTAANPMLLLNNWIESLPRSPDKAAEVNDFETLLKRTRRCERRRGLMPTILGVDFYDQGDVIGVANKVNGLERDAEATVRDAR